MSISDRVSFLDAASRGINFIPLVQTWPADLETPLSTWLKIGQKNPPGVLLESVEGGDTLGRWSVVASNPLWVVTIKGEKITRTWRNNEKEEFVGNPFELLRKCLAPYKSQLIPGLPSLGQLYGMWGYELIKWIEPKVPVYSQNDEQFPDGIWMFMDKILIFDQVKRLITAVSYGDLTSADSPEDAYEKAFQGIKEFESLMQEPLPSIKSLKWNQKPSIPDSIESNWSKSEFEHAVEEAKEYISKGDIFQLVLSQKFTTQVPHSPLELYRSLRIVNPSPFMAFYDFGDWQLIGSSPEVMVQAKPIDKKVSASLRPIAGTRPRGKTANEDSELEAQLLADPKEIAEHVMLVDLGRNDLGRVCRAGSVSVNELMIIEKYSHVMHIVSELQGYLKDDMDVWDLLMAAFPAGTVSGAPKIRAMQLIHELEPHIRGPYSGVYGSMDLNGALNTAITIRTMLVSHHSKDLFNVEVQAGAGIVADSIPQNEFQETLNKAKGMLIALGCLEPSI
ncbi:MULTISPECIES: anthranilate synthase component I family protein [Prochlorococcus]|uniref:Anthranilate synthase component 1 n=1 Tax=Prochlorococcus marinus (strain SARG / CCMP1375 / SS120) TaxID=167539 RepID=Q7V9U2_PROMA|nr:MULTISPECIES: anthranilate synthase component I family protein [Prochlorococcus]AAQ00776.1 Anthranilate/para-aminobenzoate synthase component I [Prochlorococcus marinus subsp. marinus str. CCMP1375]KGG10729.1 Anthranilate synthase [Prochlorococcus marinus str. LG]KGG21151.1 Anthranilate synthase [Prochlorococcus marinus str. SS2]KGG23975.1 Anthranilate synthase [Prochlorococcus marinus str. SS35]KGG31765.1 Anthranilate synthase [Prochlorococcus marinus str. SS51]